MGGRLQEAGLKGEMPRSSCIGTPSYTRRDGQVAQDSTRRQIIVYSKSSHGSLQLQKGLRSIEIRRSPSVCRRRRWGTTIGAHPATSKRSLFERQESLIVVQLGKNVLTSFVRTSDETKRERDDKDGEHRHALFQVDDAARNRDGLLYLPARFFINVCACVFVCVVSLRVAVGGRTNKGKKEAERRRIESQT